MGLGAIHGEAGEQDDRPGQDQAEQRPEPLLPGEQHEQRNQGGRLDQERGQDALAQGQPERAHGHEERCRVGHPPWGGRQQQGERHQQDRAPQHGVAQHAQVRKQDLPDPGDRVEPGEERQSEQSQGPGPDRLVTLQQCRGGNDEEHEPYGGKQQVGPMVLGFLGAWARGGPRGGAHRRPVEVRAASRAMTPNTAAQATALTTSHSRLSVCGAPPMVATSPPVTG